MKTSFTALCRQRGNALLEMALILPLVIAVVIYCADLYRVNLARADIERAAHTLASVLAQQNELDQTSLDALINQVAATDDMGNYELVVSRVKLDRTLPWQPLYRGSETGLCTELSSGGTFAGSLPEEQSTADDGDISNGNETSAGKVSMMVVQLCRNSSDLGLSTGILNAKVMEAVAISRMAFANIDLDEALTQELGVEEDDDQDATL